MLIRIKWRLIILFIAYLSVLVVVLFRIIWIQVKMKNIIQASTRSRVETFNPTFLPKPPIRDRTGVDLAVSLPRPSLWVNPQLLEKKIFWANKLGPLLKVAPQKLIQSWNTSRRFVWVKRLIDPKDESKLKLLGLPKAFGWVTEYERVYPLGKAFEPLIGISGLDQQGLSNLERILDKFSTKHEDIQIVKDGAGRIIKLPWEIAHRFIDTPTIDLTVDATLQLRVHQRLQRAIEYHGAQQAFALGVDVDTGEVLVASWVTRSVKNFFKNPFMSELFEWGSVIKPLVVYQSLKNQVIQTESKWDVGNGRIQIGRHTIKDAHFWQKELTLGEALVVSSNIVMAQMAFRWQPQEFRQMWFDLGFLERPWMDTPFGVWVGGGPALMKKGKLSPVDRAVMAFGQSIAGSAWHLVRAYLRMIHGESSVNLCWIKPCRRSWASKPDSQAYWVFERLKEVVESPHGTGQMARIVGVPVAGKTGTAQKPSSETRSYESGKYLASFIGIAPWPNPRFLLLVGVDEPRQNGYYGGQVAAPLWREIMVDLLKIDRVENPLLGKSVDRELAQFNRKDHELASSPNPR